MQNRKFILFLIQITLTIFCLKAQDSGSTVIPENTIVLQHRFKDNALYIRWGVTDKSVWKYGNEYGYIIERTTLTVNGEKPTKIILTGKPIKPKPFLEWEQLAKENDMAAVVAQALYGDDFNVNDNTNNKVMQVINESSELQQRFGFSMFAVDQNFKVAQFAGLGFIDDDIDASKRYLYKIKMAVPEELLKIKEEGFIADPSIKKPLPKPYDFAGYYYNDAFVLIWEYDALRNFYNAYDLEKSEDGITFTKINKVPITKLADTEVSGISYTDIISQYEKEYWYRIIGKTIFDESSPLSDTISVIAHKALLVAPELRENEIVSDKEVVLKWNFAQDEAWKLTGFDILRANNAIGPYIEIKKDLSPEERMYRYSELQDINYFKIRAKGIAEDYQDSSPNMVQPIDSVPPSQPTGLIGSIDTLGVVRLSWRKNLELDLKGYSVLKANRPNKEYTRLNKAEISGIAYIDTVNLKTFNEKVFYKIVALDNRYNESMSSNVIELQRPDIVAPMSALFTDYEAKEEGVALTWQNSASEDVIKHIIYRKKAADIGEVPWENIYETDNLTTYTFLDENTEPGSKFLYTIIAIDASGFESEPAPLLSVITASRLLRPGIKGFYSAVNRESKYIQLSWRYQEPNVAELQLFRKGNEKEFSLYQKLDDDTRQFLDSRVTPNSIYTYAIKAIFNDGSVSKWKEIEVKY